MSSRELIVLIPGLARIARQHQRELFVSGMVATAERPLLRRVDEPDVPPAAVRLRADEREIDVYEAYWNDLVPSMAHAGVRAKIARGTSLLIYWGFSRIWRGMGRRKYLTLGLLASAVALLAWYYGTAALFLDAVLVDPQSSGAVRGSASFVRQVLDTIAGWEVWLGASLLMGIIPVPVLIDIMDFSKRFLTNEISDEAGLGLRSQIRNRVREQLLAALDCEDYSRLTVVGHSFGTVVAVDLLADLPLSKALRIRFVTLGSPIDLLTSRASWLNDEVERCARRPDLEAWLDVSSGGDWFASGTELPETRNFHALTVPAQGTFIDIVTGRTHARYFDNPEAVSAVLSVTDPGNEVEDHA